MNILDYVQQLVNLSPRFAEGEVRTAEFIKKLFENKKVVFLDQQYETSVPRPKKVELIVDGKKIDARNVGSESGVFEGKDSLVSSLYWGDNDFYFAHNINFNPRCKDTVSMALYYKHPAIAIRRSDVQKVLEAKEVKGETVVEPYKFTGHNYLVGNTKNPQNIIFTHYDCWENGAIDNASGTAVTLDLVINNPELFKENLFVIAGNEEISYDEPIYWGRGYRAFQKEYNSLLDNAKSVLVVDCVGYSEHEWSTDPAHVVLGLPLDNFDKYASKCKMLCGDLDCLLEVYHSDDDTVELLSEDFLQKAKHTVLMAIR